MTRPSLRPHFVPPVPPVPPRCAQAFEPAPWDDRPWVRARALLMQCLDPWHAHPQVAMRLATMSASEFPTLVACADFHGMLPLLVLHAGEQMPPALRRALAPLRLRAARAAAARHAVLAALLLQCHTRGVQVLLLKGTALRYTVYPEATLRPMRDLDLMPAPGQMDGFLDAMQALGFIPAGAPPPAGHHHLQVQCLVRDHVAVYVEPHANLGLSRKDDIAPQALWAAAVACQIDAAQAWVPSVEHLLWHVYRHGFAMPFDTEASKLIWWADLHALGEHWGAHPALAEALRARPALRPVLAALHAAAPWSPRVQRALAPATLGAFRDLSDYAGWPRTALWRDGSGAAWGATVWPPSFWLAMRHGARAGAWAWAGMHVRHWRDLLQQWAKVR